MSSNYESRSENNDQRRETVVPDIHVRKKGLGSGNSKDSQVNLGLAENLGSAPLHRKSDAYAYMYSASDPCLNGVLFQYSAWISLHWTNYLPDRAPTLTSSTLPERLEKSRAGQRQSNATNSHPRTNDGLYTNGLMGSLDRSIAKSKEVRVSRTRDGHYLRFRDPIRLMNQLPSSSGTKDKKDPLCSRRLHKSIPAGITKARDSTVGGQKTPS